MLTPNFIISVPPICGFQPSITGPDSLGDAIVTTCRENLSIRSACQKYNVSTRIIKTTITALEAFEEVRGAPLCEDSRNYQVFRWVTHFTGGSKKEQFIVHRL